MQAAPSPVAAGAVTQRTGSGLFLQRERDHDNNVDARQDACGMRTRHFLRISLRATRPSSWERKSVEDLTEVANCSLKLPRAPGEYIELTGSLTVRQISSVQVI
jgi:hypothetical protein